MPSLSLATFNCENLMMRCDFRRAGGSTTRHKLKHISNVADADAIDSVFNVLSEDDRTLTAQALVQANADICVLQEVENLVTLTAFDTRYVARWAGRPFGNRILHEGNDPRGIDVAALSRLPIAASTSHAHLTFQDLGVTPPPGEHPNDRAFRRDCLELDVVKDGRALTLFVCHFKSMKGGRAETRAVRRAEAEAVKAIIARRFETPDSAEWIILGDFNDFIEQEGVRVHDHGLAPFLDDGFSFDLAELVIADPSARWSHHYAIDDTYNALDHMFLSPPLAAQNKTAKARYIRAGTPYRSTRHRGFRFPGIGWAIPKASDHCPFHAVIQFEGRPMSD